MNLKTTVIAIAGLSLAAVVFAQTSQSSSTQSSRGGNAQTSTSSSSSAYSSSSKSASANSSSSKNAGGGSNSSGSGNGSGSGFGLNAKPTHAILYTLDSSVANSNDAKDKAFAQHSKYLGEQQGKGKVVLYGPWRDLPGSMAVIVAQSDAEANEIAKNDPAVKSGALTFEVRAWLVMAPAQAGSGQNRN
jgi:uncharacterized protein